MKRFLLLLLCGALMVSFCSCAPTAPSGSTEPTQSNQPGSTQSPSSTPGTEPTTTPSSDPNYINNTYVQTPDVRDYTYSWWPNSTGSDKDHNFCVQTGYYGISFSSITGMPIRMGYISNTYSQTAALTQNEDVINTLPAMSVSASVTLDKKYNFTGTISNAMYSRSALRIIESGQYMQSFEVGAMEFADSNGNKNDKLIGRTEIKATPKYFALNYQMFFTQKTEVSLEYNMTFDEALTATVAADGKSAIFVRDGGGFCMVMPEGSISYDSASRTVTLKEDAISCKPKKFNGLSVIIIPSASPSQADIDYYNAVSSVSISATKIQPSQGKSANVDFDADRGVWTIDTSRMTNIAGTGFAQEKNQNLADRLSFSITNDSEKAVTIPLCFSTEKSGFAVEGFGPMIRDVNTGEPVGLQIQISKNWHPYNTEHRNEWYYGLDGRWYHGYTYVEVPAGKTITYEYMNVYNNYGTVNVASHSQLCLIGWPSYSTHQIWHTSTIGSTCESFCYDPDFTCGYGFINDVRGVGFDPADKGGSYGWGCNNGGGNFIWYGNNGTNNFGDIQTVGYKNMKVFYKTYAPNMAEVIFSGVTQDDAVQFKITTYISRTNDVSRATHTFEYNFLKDVSFERMAFYQIGGDRHNSGRWHGLTIGNNDGPIEYEIDGVKYGAEAEMPVYETAGYIGDTDEMQRIEVPGEGLWIAFTDSYKKVNSDYFDGDNANRMLSLLDFDATLNGTHYDKPAFNVRSTEMFCGDSTLVELCPPASVGNTVSAGSYVKGAVEYINLPPSLSSVYFNSPVLKSFPAEEFDTWKLAYRYAMGDKTKATASIGTVVRQYPIAVKCQDGDVLAQVSIKGGISYLPITFTDVPSFAGYRLEKKVGDTWEMVDQSYFGNDYWQTYYDPETGKYELTFNVEHNGDVNAVYEYRLVKK